MTRRPTIGADPFDALVAGPAPVQKPPAAQKAQRAPRAARKAEKPAEAPVAPRLVKATYNLPTDLVEETRNAVVALAGPPLRLTLSALVLSALRRELERLRKAHNAGEPFPGPGHALKGGRPVK